VVEEHTSTRPATRTQNDIPAGITSVRKENGWSVARWLALIVGFFVLQFGFLYVVSERPLAESQLRGPRIIARMLPGNLTEGRVSENFFTSDPLLFPLASQHGFSGKGWMTMRRPNYELPEEIEPPHWLGLRADKLGVVAPAEPKAELPFQLGHETSPQTEALPVFVPTISARTNSLVRVDSTLRERAIGLPFALPARPSSEVLSNTVVDIAVNGAGEVVASRLALSSNSKVADREALNKSKLLRFRPLNAVGTIWGQAIFEWETTAHPEEKAK
jgi:hypothetical protein